MRKILRIIAYLYVVALTILLSLNRELGYINWLPIAFAAIGFIGMLIRNKIIDRVIGLLSASFFTFLIMSLYKEMKWQEWIIFSLALLCSLMIYVYHAQKKLITPQGNQLIS